MAQRNHDISDTTPGSSSIATHSFCLRDNDESAAANANAATFRRRTNFHDASIPSEEHNQRPCTHNLNPDESTPEETTWIRDVLENTLGVIGDDISSLIADDLGIGSDDEPDLRWAERGLMVSELVLDYHCAF